VNHIEFEIWGEGVINRDLRDHHALMDILEEVGHSSSHTNGEVFYVDQVLHGQFSLYVNSFLRLQVALEPTFNHEVRL